MKLFGPEQPNPPGLELMLQGQLQLLQLGALFEEEQEDSDDSDTADLG